MNIYGNRIYMLWSDVCGRDIAKMIAVLRAVKLGLVFRDVVDHAIDNRGQGLDLDATVKLVVDHLSPHFN